MASKRKSISKRLRFEIFKRDSFGCQYCGSRPPEVPLEIDHIIPVSKGGTNDVDNLITACFDCNRGKSDKDLTDIPSKLAEKIERSRIAQDQYKQYQKLLKDKKRMIQRDIDMVEAVYSASFEGWVFSDRFRLSVKAFIEKLGVDLVAEAMEKACSRVYDEDQALKYFCGICWNFIREGGYE